MFLVKNAIRPMIFFCLTMNYINVLQQRLNTDKRKYVMKKSAVTFSTSLK